MTWILFDNEDRQTPIPRFQLPKVGGGTVALEDYRGRERLVVFFPHNLRCEACRAALQSFTDHRREYVQEGTEVLVILPEPLVRLEADDFYQNLPFPVLSDPEGATRRTLAGLMAAELVKPDDDLLFVLDEYGAPYTALIESEFDDPAIHQDILKWLEFIQIQCPE